MKHEFPCGTRVLDYAATLRARNEDEPFDFLTGPDSLQDWFTAAALRTDGAGVDGGGFAEAIELREAICTLVWHRMNDAPLPPAALALVNARAAQPSPVPRLTTDGVAVTADLDQCLSQLAREAVDLVGGTDAALLRECSRPECTTIYLDRSRGHRREWCSMKSCGNRVKAAAYRARRRGEDA